jgi:hypothetical protein
MVWRRYARRHPWLDALPDITQTKDGIPGDPINVALVGTEAQLTHPDSGRLAYGRSPGPAQRSAHRRRHHVCFWRSDQHAEDGLPVWMGSVTLDERVGFSHTTGQITHHIAADVDAERDRLFQQLQAASCLADMEMIDDFPPSFRATTAAALSVPIMVETLPSW